MRTAKTARRLPILAAGLLLLAACSDDGGTAAPVDLESPETGATEDESAVDDGAGDETAADDARDDGIDTAGLVDMTEAVPGTWPVGDAGTVTFAIVDGALVLEDVTAADGWQADIDEQDPDEIEVDFRRGDTEWRIEIELKDGATTLEIEIDQHIERADAGSYDIGDAGTFAFSVSDGRLVLDDLNVADGWTVAERDEEADEIEFTLVNGPREFDVQVELEDDGSIEIEIDYAIVGPVAR
jgi:hypothetical protein